MCKGYLPMCSIFLDVLCMQNSAVIRICSFPDSVSMAYWLSHHPSLCKSKKTFSAQNGESKFCFNPRPFHSNSPNFLTFDPIPSHSISFHFIPFHSIPSLSIHSSTAQHALVHVYLDKHSVCIIYIYIYILSTWLQKRLQTRSVFHSQLMVHLGFSIWFSLVVFSRKSS